jgi:Protein of unknown function (DUF2950)
MSSIHRITSHFVPFALVLAALNLTYPAHGQAAGQKTFSSPKDAVSAFIQAVRDRDTSELVAILGPGSEQIVSTSDSVADSKARASFLTRYDERHALIPARNGELTLQVGKDGWPLPIPLAKSGNSWYWDGAAGKQEILYRRIGHNELDAISVCHGIVAAQRDYAASGHDGRPAGAYAPRLVSEPGKQNGLYWEPQQGEPQSPAGPMLASASAEGYDVSGKRTPYHGYYYRMLPSSSGFGFIAYPADYRASGVMTFLVNQKGVIYQKDLGEKTTEIAQQMTTYAIDASWAPVK